MKPQKHRTFFLALLLATPLCSQALHAQDDDDFTNEPLDLGVMDVRVERWSYEQEMVLRMVRTAFEEPYSVKYKDRNKWRCWIEDATGSRLSRLYCARMGDISARKPGEFRTPWRSAGYGRFLESTKTVNRGVFLELLAELSGDEQFNDEFVRLVTEGGRPPRHFPREEEIDAFLDAVALVNDAREQAEELVEFGEIRGSGIRLSRYNEIAQMMELFPSVKGAVLERATARGMRASQITVED